LHDTFMQRYKDDFWADAVLLRQAIVARLGSVPGAPSLEPRILFCLSSQQIFLASNRWQTVLNFWRSR